MNFLQEDFYFEFMLKCLFFTYFQTISHEHKKLFQKILLCMKEDINNLKKYCIKSDNSKIIAYKDVTNSINQSQMFDTSIIQSETTSMDDNISRANSVVSHVTDHNVTT